MNRWCRASWLICATAVTGPGDQCAEALDRERDRQNKLATATLAQHKLDAIQGRQLSLKSPLLAETWATLRKQSVDAASRPGSDPNTASLNLDNAEKLLQLLDAWSASLVDSAPFKPRPGIPLDTAIADVLARRSGQQGTTHEEVLDGIDWHQPPSVEDFNSDLSRRTSRFAAASNQGSAEAAKLIAAGTGIEALLDAGWGLDAAPAGTPTVEALENPAMRVVRVERRTGPVRRR